MASRLTTGIRAAFTRAKIPEEKGLLILNTQFRSWSPEEIQNVLDQLGSFRPCPGNDDPCGPPFNHLSKWPMSMSAIFLLTKVVGVGFLFLIQLPAAVYVIVWRQRLSALVHELPKPSIDLMYMFSNLSTFVKPSQHLVQESIAQRKALCVNRKGQFKLIGPNDQDTYAVLSYVWGDVMAWPLHKRWGSVDLSIRRRGLPLEHLERLFDACCEPIAHKGAHDQVLDDALRRTYDYHWMWLDVVAMPEILEDMTDAQRKETEVLRTGVINTLADVYGRCSRVTVVDGTLRRLRTGSMIDCAVILCFSRWITRLWPYVESRLAPKVLLRTADYAFDLDEIISFLSRIIDNDRHRYFNVYSRLSYLRPTPKGVDRLQFRSEIDYQTAQEGGEIHIMRDILAATQSCQTNVRVDHARVLYPLTCKQWTAGWNVEDGFTNLYDVLPDHRECIDEYYQFRKPAFQKEDCVKAKTWSHEVVDAHLAEAY